jgi:hypothetical protein
MARVKSTPNVKRIFSPPKPFDGFFERLAALPPLLPLLPPPCLSPTTAALAAALAAAAALL